MLARVDHIDEIIQGFIAANNRAFVVPAISGRVTLHEMLTSQATTTLCPFKNKLR